MKPTAVTRLLLTMVLAAGLVAAAATSVSAQLEDDPVIDSAAVAEAVADELAEPKYRLGPSLLERVWEFLARFWIRFVEWATRMADYVGGPVVAGALLGGAIVVTTVIVTANLGRRRARRVDERIRRDFEAARGLDPDQLERESARAEEAGDHALALRLLFRAGLIRLDRAGLIDLRPGTTSGTLAEQIGSPSFTSLVERFDAVTYGDKPASTDDVQNARQILDAVLSARMSAPRVKA